MSGTKFEFQSLRLLLRRRADDPAVLEVIEQRPALIERNAHLGFVELRPVGIAVVFMEEQWVVPPADVTDPATLRLSAFHFYSEGYEDYSQYQGQLPGGVDFGDPEAAVIRKLGEPSASGGGGWSAMLKQTVNRWLRYNLDEDILQFQLTPNGRVDLVTLEVPDIQHIEGSA